MKSWEILHRFKEATAQDAVVWFKEEYEEVRDGIGHTGPHLEVETHFDIVRRAIEDPDDVRQDKDYKNRKCYYAHSCGGADFPNCHMKVVLEHTWYGKIRVVTAYFTLDFGQGEVTIWTKK